MNFIQSNSSSEEEDISYQYKIVNFGDFHIALWFFSSVQYHLDVDRACFESIFKYTRCCINVCHKHIFLMKQLVYY